MVCFEYPNTSGLPIGVFENNKKVTGGKDAQSIHLFVSDTEWKPFMAHYHVLL